MIARRSGGFTPSVLIVDDELANPATTRGSRLRAIAQALGEAGAQVVEALSLADGRANIVSNAGLHVVMVDLRLSAGLETPSDDQATDLLRA